MIEDSTSSRVWSSHTFAKGSTWVGLLLSARNDTPSGAAEAGERGTQLLEVRARQHQVDVVVPGM